MIKFESIFEKQLANLRQRQEILAILIFSLVTIMLWVALELVSSQQRSSISAELQRLALPLTPTIQTQVIDELEQKRHYGDNELLSFPIYRILTAKERDQRSRQQTEPAANESGTSGLGTLTSNFLEPEVSTESAATSTPPSNDLIDSGNVPEAPESTPSATPDTTLQPSPSPFTSGVETNEAQ